MRISFFAIVLVIFVSCTASAGNSIKAAYMAPYWAAEIRQSIDVVLGESVRK